ncbi:uncharacterized protein LOC108677100 isoform X2 [Hyalella azteca]|uniref:Uncharacterized protein LOC108677100 isoform X1 n=1 Tax=Hyalella azteca TaxID=294128 RepID=A0A8B7P3P3_HYAAZ|nr:uncharacterized protein LOC108677100 isoform X1 [Hyalella azteca]XP_047736075.1 uncharacterized protein LOC108677100 isoform X2 [Hyalella azteca]
MEVRERHNLSRTSDPDDVSSMDPNALPSNAPVYKTRTSRSSSGSVDGPPVYHDPNSRAWEGEIESEEICDGSYGSREQLTKKNLMNEETWMFPVRPVFPSDEDSDEEEDEEMAMMTTCCCCFSTKNGSIAVGIICLIVSFLICVSLSFTLINLPSFTAALKQYYDATHSTTTNATSILGIVDNIIGFNNFVNHLQTVVIVLLVFYALYTFSSLFLTYGACTNLRSLLLPWVVLEFGPFAAQLGGIIFLFVYGKDDAVLSKGGTYIIAGLLQIIAFVIHVYWWMCPVAHYQSLKEGTEVESLVPQQPQYPGRLNKY